MMSGNAVIVSKELAFSWWKPLQNSGLDIAFAPVVAKEDRFEWEDLPDYQSGKVSDGTAIVVVQLHQCHPKEVNNFLSGKYMILPQAISRQGLLRNLTKEAKELEERIISILEDHGGKRVSSARELKAMESEAGDWQGPNE